VTVSVKKQIDELRSLMGFNILELSKIFKVQRPTIYEWLAGKSPSIKNRNKLDEIYKICQIWLKKDIGKLGEYLHQKSINNSTSLMDLFEKDMLDESAINKIFYLITKSIIKTKQRLEEMDKFLKSNGFKDLSIKEQKEKLMQISRKIN